MDQTVAKESSPLPQQLQIAVQQALVEVMAAAISGR
jgi:hypothetical protein